MSQSIDLSSRADDQSTPFIIRSCDRCRKKKIRCDVTSDACLECIKYQTPCHFTPINLKRKPRRPPGEKRVEKLEKKLRWMEDQLKRSVEYQRLKTDAESSNKPRGLQTPSPDQSGDGTSYLIQNIQDDYLMDPGFAVPEVSLEAPNFREPFRKPSFSLVPESQFAISPWNLTSVSNVFTRPIFESLPPKDRAFNLIKKSFEGFNCAYPLFDPATFMRSFESLDANINDPDWWACLNVVLALTHQFAGTTTMDREEDRESWMYFQNALAVSHQLTTMRSTLMSVQALLGMSIVIMGTPNQSPAFVLTSSAIKLAQNMGLHRRNQDPGLSAAEVEQRKRVFWSAYCLDKDISLQTGLPPAQDEDDMDVELPFENNGAPLRHGEPHGVDFFNFRIRLAMIQGKIYKRLCSVKATKQSTSDRVMAAKELEAMLHTWRASFPVNIQQDSRPNLQVPTSDLVPLSTGLQLAYFNSLAAIYGSLPMLHTSAPVDYVAEARKAIKELQFVPRRRNACIRAVLHIFVSATTTLLTYTLSNPSNPLALADLKLIEPLLSLLRMLSKSDMSDEISPIYRSCAELFERAKMAVWEFNPVGMSWDRRGTSAESGGRESVEDFLRRMESISSGYV